MGRVQRGKSKQSIDQSSRVSCVGTQESLSTPPAPLLNVEAGSDSGGPMAGARGTLPGGSLCFLFLFFKGEGSQRLQGK